MRDQRLVSLDVGTVKRCQTSEFCCGIIMRGARSSVALMLLVGLIASLSGCNMTSGYLNNHAGTRHYEQGNYTAAREAFRRAAADNPQKADYVHNLAAAMKKQGDVAGAERVYQQALNIDPAHQPSYHSLAMMLNEQGRTAESTDLVTTWADTQPYVPESHIELAWLQRESGNPAAAEQALQRALQVDPGNPIATAQLGQLYQDSGQSNRALAMYQRSLHSNWFQPDVQSRVATMGREPNSLMGTPVTAYARPPAYLPQTVTAGRFGTSQRVALMYPLPTYSHATGGIPVTGTPTLALQPSVPATTVLGGDPAHVPQLSSDIPEVQPH